MISLLLPLLTEAVSSVVFATALSSGSSTLSGGFIHTTPAFGGVCEETQEIFDQEGKYLGIRSGPCSSFYPYMPDRRIVPTHLDGQPTR